MCLKETNRKGTNSWREVPAIISSILKEVGVPPRLLGYYYLRRAIEIVLTRKGRGKLSMTDLYKVIRLEEGVSPQSIERTIRSAIEVAWCRGNTEAIYNYFGYSIDAERGKPTNSEFIACIADVIRLQLRV